jgi:hypothetical protein
MLEFFLGIFVSPSHHYLDSKAAVRTAANGIKRASMRSL